MAYKNKEAKNETDLDKIHEQALRLFDGIQSAHHDERMQCLQDRRFYSVAGAQWEGKYGDQFENRPKFEVNKIHLAVMRIINEYRQNRITVDFQSKDGSKDDELADLCDGLYRADEQDSVADEAYDNAFEEAVGGGFGAFRLRTEYEDDLDPENERQRIRIEPIYDADSSVFYDLGAKRQDKKDAKCCFVITSMTHDAYEEEYGESPSSWSKDIHQTEYDWNTEDAVYVAEYYKVTEATETLRIYADIEGDESTYTEQELDEEDDETGITMGDRLIASGHSEVRTRKIKRRRVRKYVMSGGSVLEDCGLLLGENIPIVPVYGKRWFVDNVERCMGHVRLAKDAQILKNIQLSKLGELSAQFSTEKPIMTPEQIGIHGPMWAEDNITNFPYLFVEAITDAQGNPTVIGPTAYTKPPQIPPALGALLQITESDIQDILGKQASDEVNPNLSGVAVEQIHGRLDMQTFIYLSNMSKAIRRAGEIWLSMAREVFVEEGRRVKLITKQDATTTAKLMQPKSDPKSGDIVYTNNLKEAKFDVAVSVGPSSSSKRQATVRVLTNMMGMVTDPELGKVLVSTALMNVEGEGLADLSDYLRKQLLRMGAAKPTDEEKEQLEQEMQNQPPDGQQQLLQAAAQEAQAKAKKAQADAVLTLAKARETQADTDQTEVETAELLKSVSREDLIRAAQLAQVEQMLEQQQQQAQQQAQQQQQAAMQQAAMQQAQQGAPTLPGEGAQ